MRVDLEKNHPQILEEGVVKRALKVLQDGLHVIETGSERVTGIVKRLKTFARLDEAELQLADIHAGIEDTLVLLAHELKKGVEVEKSFGTIPKINCYPGQLNQVFLNVLVNAVQAIDGKGKITIETRSEDSQVVVKIADDGSGIPPEALPRIFDPGFTTKGVGVGTGLGLSIVYGIIQDHAGDISVESEVGRGTAFTIRLPIALARH
jgi:signal transduction histidine kinase